MLSNKVELFSVSTYSTAPVLEQQIKFYTVHVNDCYCVCTLFV